MNTNHPCFFPSRCPKCGSQSVSKPRYEKKSFGKEALVFFCLTCDYQMERPCIDAASETDKVFGKVG